MPRSATASENPRSSGEDAGDPAPWPSTSIARAPSGTIVRGCGSSGMRWDDASVEGRLFLGTSGFAYEEWRHGVFYPEGVTASRMLRHYSSVFGSVEINYTFRKWPSEKVVDAWREQTPDGFRFAVKANQRITHTRRLANAGPDLREFATQARRLGDRLGPVLVQLPPNLPYDETLLRGFADDLPDGI